MVTLELKNLGFQYREQTVFQNISLSTQGGRLLSLVGPNGAGKTTLLKCINRLLIPKDGTIFINGTNISDLSRRELARRIAYVPQSEQVRFPISAFDAVMLGRRPYWGWHMTARDLDAVLEIFCRMEIENLAEKNLDQMSGGERQKVMLAKAIVQKPEILLLDEPTTFLDMGYQLKILELVRTLVRKQQICAVMTTHEINYALHYSDSIAILQNGVIRSEGPPDSVTEQTIRDVYSVESRIYQEEDYPFLIPIRAL